MNYEHALIAAQAIEIHKLTEQKSKMVEALNDIRLKLICIGGPLNDNKHGYSPEQKIIFFQIEELVNEAMP